MEDRNNKRWSLQEDYLALLLRDQHYHYKDIGDVLARTKKAITARVHYLVTKHNYTTQALADKLKDIGYHTLPSIKNGEMDWGSREPAKEDDKLIAMSGEDIRGMEEDMQELEDKVADLEYELKRVNDHRAGLIKKVNDLESVIDAQNEEISADNSAYWREKCKHLEKQLDEKSKQYDLTLMRYYSEELRLVRKHNEMLIEKVSKLLG